MKKIFSFLILLLIFSHKISDAQWVQMSNGIPNGNSCNCFCLNGNNLFAGTPAGIYVSSNNGINWTASYTGLTFPNVYSLLSTGSYIFAGVYSGGVFRSSDNGVTWTAANNGILNYVGKALLYSGTNLFVAVSSPGGVFRSSNNGDNWIQCNNGLPNAESWSLVKMGTDLFISIGTGIYKSTNDGNNWISISNLLTYSLFVNNTTLYAGGYHTLNVSTNSGINWTSCSIPNSNLNIYTITMINSNIIVGGADPMYQGCGVYMSTNNGSTWLAKNQGLNSSQFFNSLFIKDNFIFAGLQYDLVWRRGLTEITEINHTSNSIPEKFKLSQNYPNPFNPDTKIKFSIQKYGKVILKVYDNIGREIATLINESLRPGIYEVPFSINQFSGNTFSSGIYFYRLTTENFIDVKKMILLK